MDLLTADLLKRWGFEEYIHQFRDGRVDSGTLRLLTDDEIGQLMPVPGDRARFKNYLNNWKKELAQLNSNNSLELNNSFAALIRNTIDEDYLFEELDQNPPENFLNSPNSPFAEGTSERGSLPPRNPLPGRVSSPAPEAPTSPSVENTPRPYISSPLSPDSHSISDGTVQSPLPPRSSHSAENATVQCGYVLQTLKASVDGRAILRKREEGKLDEHQRNILVRLLLLPIFEKDPNAQITNKQLLSWSLEIQAIFKKESAALYYTPYVSALVHADARNASGKLLRFVYNKRSQLRNRGIIERPRSRSRESSASASSSSDVSPLIRLPAASAETNEELKEKLEWLRNSLEPWHLVEEKWAATAALRMKTNYLGGSSVQEYFNEYPVLKTPSGYQLLLSDFQTVYADKTDALFSRILTLREKVIEIAKNRLENTRDKDVRQSLEQYLTAFDEASAGAEGSDVKNNAVLMLLPYITSSVPLKGKKKILGNLQNQR